jgi:hypothetical protein
MTQHLDDIINNIKDAIEPDDFIDRLGISAEDLAERLNITINTLCGVYREEIAEDLQLFEDVYNYDSDEGSY